jgi:hypothetical protein
MEPSDLTGGHERSLGRSPSNRPNHRRLVRAVGIAAVALIASGTAAGATSKRAVHPAESEPGILLSDVVDRPDAAVADPYEEGRGHVDYLRLVPADLVDELVTSLQPDAVDEDRSCQALEPRDATVRVHGEAVAFAGAEASLCDPGPGSYVVWHGQRRTGDDEVLASASLAVIFDDDGTATGATGTVEDETGGYELMPVDDDTYGLAEIVSPHHEDDEISAAEDREAAPSGPGSEEPTTTTTTTEATTTTSLANGEGSSTTTTPPPGDQGPGGGNPQPPAPPTAPRSGIPGDGAADAAPGDIDGGQPRPGGPPGNRTIQVRFGYASGITASEAYLYLVNRTSQTNESFINSNVPVRVEGLGPVSAGYTQSGSLATDFDALANPTDGPMDALYSDFVSSHADLLALLVPNPDTLACGYGSLTNEVTGTGRGLSVSAVNSCNDYTVTHELGHNLSAHHNPENASGQTAFPWSYGHYALGKARDVMSYADPCSTSACPRVLQWSDPDNGFLGFTSTPSGTPYRDNDRSITDSSWAVGQSGNTSSNDSIWYRSSSGHTSVGIPNDVEAPYTPIAGDFNGDGTADQFWYFPGRPLDTMWEFGTTRGSYGDFSSDVVGSYRPVAGDFDGDGRSDIFWHGPGNQPDVIWWGTPNAIDFGTVVTTTTVTGTYAPQAGDIDGDGRDDLVWYAPGTGADYIWWGNATRSSFASGSGSTGITVNGLYYLTLGDHDDDGRDDLSWFTPGTGSDFIWHGMASHGAVGPSNQTGYTQNGDRVPKTGDFNGDGRDDIFWYGTGSEPDSIWWGQTSMSSFVSAPGWTGQTVSGWYAPTTGDFDADGYTDIYWFSFG